MKKVVKVTVALFATVGLWALWLIGTVVFLVSGGSFFLALHKCYELNSVANHDITTLMMSFSGLIIGFLMCVFSDTIREEIEFDF